MQIHEISSGNRLRRKRVGRGGKRGTYSGRGNKGQKARSGAHVNPLFEGGHTSIVDRLKKVRGFKSPHAKKSFVKLSDIVRVFTSEETVSAETLVAKNLAPTEILKSGVKIIGLGTVPKNLSFDSALSFSESVRAGIEKSGGKMVSMKKSVSADNAEEESR
ncbi:MAG: 50S ribosomal protein L15 [Candidatus Moraniibacteriota bacterium]|nr:MAG: 50S ribosomal protein L15 [Candidatus Moranbacteria bacterium]